MASDDASSYDSEGRQRIAEDREIEAETSRRDWLKQRDRRRRSHDLKARKTRGGRRDLWAECIRREGVPKGYRIVPDDALPHAVKYRRSRSLERAEDRRRDRQPVADRYEQPDPPAPKLTEGGHMVTMSPRMQQARELALSCKITPELAEEAGRLAQIRDKALRNDSYDNRSIFMNSAQDWADYDAMGIADPGF